MRAIDTLRRWADTVLPEDTESAADDDQIKANVFYGLSGFMVEQTVRLIGDGTPPFSRDTLILAAAGVALSGGGLHLSERARSAQDG